MCEYIQKRDSTNEPRKMCRQLIDLAKEIINSLKFCIVSTCRYEDAYTLFEVLNDRALAIEDVDLVKNLLFRTYCLTDKVDDELQKDSNIQEIDDIWGNDIFSNLSATQSKLIQYLSTCFLTADTSLIYKEDIKFRKPLQTYLELNYNESCQYTYIKLFNDVAVYRMIKIITDKLGLLYNNSVLPALKAEWSDEKSITYKCLHLIYALDMKGVLAALTNLILREYFDSHVNNNSIVNFDDFAKYVVLLFEDKKHTNTDFSNIHKTAYSLWRACLLSDTANTPRQLAKKFIEKVNKTNKLERAIDFSINDEITQEFIKWTEGWRYNQNKQRNLKARIMLINLCKTEKNESTSMLEYTPGHFTITDWDSVQLDHLEAQKPDVNHISEYFMPQRDGDPRDNYTDCLGNMMLLDGTDNNNKNNLPLCKAMGYYQHMGTHWLITEIDEMINSDKYSIEINGNRVPNEEFFNERRKRLQKYFYSILQFKLSDKEGKIKDPN